MLAINPFTHFETVKQTMIPSARWWLFSSAVKKLEKYSSQMNMHIQITVITVCGSFKFFAVSPGSSKTAGKLDVLSRILPSLANSTFKTPQAVCWHGTQTPKLLALRGWCYPLLEKKDFIFQTQFLPSRFSFRPAKSVWRRLSWWPKTEATLSLFLSHVWD